MYIGSTVRSTGGTIEVAVVANGQELPLFRRPWDGKYFVPAVPGQIYTLRVRNLNGRRVEVLNSVDGRNTLKDGPADMQQNTGLVFDAYQTGEFSGWRLNDGETGDFMFGSPDRVDLSVAFQATESANNIGIIGFAAYRERTRGFNLESLIVDDSEAMRRSPTTFGGGLESYRAAKGVDFEPRGGSIGTNIGETRQNRVGRTHFTRDGSPADVLVIGYDLEEVLRAQGIIAPPEANAFPGIPTGFGKYQRA